ncbi:uncharacterized protein [Palaemon carinicauda]|uniref:uncharacterized protein n=1 Tax=Palaemon carinicauda TaxID=392227 RepID=UPI0035B64352
MRDPRVNVLVSDVQEEDIEKVGDILWALQPQDARRSFTSISFPLCSKKSRSPWDFFIPMMNSLNGVRVRNSICFPVDEEPDDEALLLEEMRLKAKEYTGCIFGVQWWTDGEMFLISP